MLRTVWAGLRARWWRLVLTGSVVVIAVGFVTATIVLTDSLDRAATDDVAREAAGVDLAVLPAEPGGEVVGADGVGEIEGVQAVAERQQIGIGTSDERGRRDPLGYGWLTAVPADPELAALDLVAGRAPEAPGEAVLDEGAAERAQVGVGDTYRVFDDSVDRTSVGTGGRVDLDVVGVTRASPAGQGAVEVGVARATFEEVVDPAAPPRVERVDLRLDPAATAATVASVRAEVSALVPGADVLDGQALEDRLVTGVPTLAGALQMPLLVLGGVAVLAAVFVVANTFRILVAQRVRELALLRTVGATRRQVLGSVLVEAVAVGLGASVLGAVLGLAAASVLGSVVGGSALPLGELVVTPSTVLVSVLVGLAVTVAAALIPARVATRVSPLAAFRVEPDGEVAGPRRARVLTGSALAVGGAGVVALGATVAAGETAGLAVVVLGATIGFLGLLVLGPVLVPRGIGLAGAGLQRVLRGSAQAPTSLAVVNARRNPGRVAATTAALLIGVTMISGFTTVVSSVRGEAADYVTGEFPSDMTVGSGDPLPAELVDAVTALDEVGASTAVRNRGVELVGTPNGPQGANFIGVGDDDGVGVAALLPNPDVVISGSIDGLGDHEVVLDADTAERAGLQVGDQVGVVGLDPRTGERAEGVDEVTVEVAAVVVSGGAFYGIGSGSALAQQVTAEPTEPDELLLTVADDADTRALEEAVLAAAADFPEVPVTSTVSAQEAVADGLDQAVAVVLAILGLAVLIAVIGIANTMSLSVHERTREIGLLRALGLTRRQLRWMVATEGALMSVVATLLGAVTGVLLALAATRSLSMSSFVVPWAVLGLAAVVGAAVGIGSALAPARRAARLSPVSALAQQ